MNINVMVAEECHTRYAEEICQEIYISSRERKTGIAKRTPEYINEKILAGKAVIALSDEGDFAGFSYIESWGGKSFVANSGLIVAHKFRGLGIAKRIKEQTFLLSRRLFPQAKLRASLIRPMQLAIPIFFAPVLRANSMISCTLVHLQ